MRRALAFALMFSFPSAALAADPAALYQEGHESRARGETADAERRFAASAEGFLAAGDGLGWARASSFRALMLNNLGRFAHALSVTDAVAAEYERRFPGGSAEYAELLADRASLLLNMSKREEGEAAARRAVAMIARVAPGNPAQPRILAVLGRSLDAQDRIREAVKIHEQAVAWARQPRIPRPTLAAALESAGVGALNAGRYDLAVERLKESVALTAEDRTESHPQTATRRYKLGWALMRAGDHAGADGELVRAHEDAAKTMGPESAIAAASLALIGELRRRQRRLDAALLADEKAAKAAVKIGNDNFIGETEKELGAVNRELGRFPEASAHFTRAAKRLTGVSLGALRYEEGLLHKAAGRGEAAASSFKEALTLYLPLGDGHPLVAEVRAALGKDAR